MRINNFFYLIKEGIKGIFKHGFMSFAAVCVTVACLLIVGTFSSLIYNLGTTLLVVTHEMDLVQRFAKRVIAIDEGLVISDGMDGYSV